MKTQLLQDNVSSYHMSLQKSRPYLLGHHFSSWSCCLETKKKQQLIGLFFWSSQKNPITAVFGDQWDCSISTKKTIRAYLIPSSNRRHVTVMKSLIFPLSLHLSPFLYLLNSVFCSPSISPSFSLSFSVPLLVLYFISSFTLFFSPSLCSHVLCFHFFGFSSTYSSLSLPNTPSHIHALTPETPTFLAPSSCFTTYSSAATGGLLLQAWRWCTYTESWVLRSGCFSPK